MRTITLCHRERPKATPFNISTLYFARLWPFFPSYLKIQFLRRLWQPMSGRTSANQTLGGVCERTWWDQGQCMTGEWVWWTGQYSFGEERKIKQTLSGFKDTKRIGIGPKQKSSEKSRDFPQVLFLKKRTKTRILDLPPGDRPEITCMWAHRIVS